MELNSLTIKKVHQALLKKEFCAKELCELYLKEIEKKNKEIFAYLTVDKKGALKKAEKIDQMIKEKKKIPILAGVPIAIKDNILVKDLPCTAGSKILENYLAPYDATVIKKIKKEGGIILGKTNLDEFAMGSSTEQSAFGITRNPHNLQRVPGGSSGGSAAAVAGNLALVALGSDTCGSVRQPACFCGIAGLRPTYGRVSRYGLISMACSFDQIGPLAKNVEDLEILFKVICGKDKMDATSSEKKERANFKISDLKIGIPREYFSLNLDQRVKSLIEKAIKKFEKLGAKTKQISLPHTLYALPAYYLIMPSEVCANLARYDGIKYGKVSKNAQNLFEVYSKTRQEYLGPEVKRRIILGTFALSHGYFEGYYLRAQKVRTKIKEDFEKAFKKVDIILTPASPGLAFKIGEKVDPLSMYLEDIFMAPSALASLPALCLPCGKIDSLPVGFQIIGNVFQDEFLLKVGKFFEKYD